MSKYAYVTFIMRNDTFLPGALVFAFALKKQKTKADLICIVSEHVSQQAINTLEELYDDVISIDEIYTPHKNRQERQDRPFLFTRFQALRLGEDGDLGKSYEKIMIADADLLPLQNYDKMFDVQAPAGVINEKKEYCMEYQDGKYIIPDSVFESETWKWHQVYKEYPYGDLIPKSITDRVLTDFNNMGVNAALYLFEPTMALFNSILEDTQNEEQLMLIAQFPWPEMQYITAKMSGKWHNLDLKYSSFNGYPIIDILNGIHFAGLKPWQLNHRSIKHFAKTEDYRLWYAVFMKMVNAYPNLLDNKRLVKLKNFVNELWKESDYHYTRHNLGNVKHLFSAE